MLYFGPELLSYSEFFEANDIFCQLFSDDYNVDLLEWLQFRTYPYLLEGFIFVNIPEFTGYFECVYLILNMLVCCPR
jgi:hypothetical protein